MPQPESNDFVANPLALRCVEVVELVTFYLDEALDASDRQGFEHHITHCEGCAIFVAQVRRTIELTAEVGRSEPVVPPANLGELSAIIAMRKGPGSTQG